jgi:hypothetical protein
MTKGAAATHCSRCGAALPAAARFCLTCGHPVDAAALPTMTPPPGARVPRAGAGSEPFDHGRFAPGTMLGDRYRIVARLGMGGMGEVFRADDLKVGQPVALKFLPESVEHDPERLEKFMAEVRTARQISHPNVCRVYDVGDMDGRRFLTMEYVDGEDLRGLLRRIGRLPEDKGLEIARQICAGLAAIHDRGVLHRDLKPANIMLDGRGRVRLTDFGVATAVESAGTDGEIAGTPAYMAPEQIAGRPLSTATDLYALGLVLFELFTGERPHRGNEAAVRDARRTPKSAVGPATTGTGTRLDPIIQRVIDRCLDRDPARRPQSAIVVAAALPGGDPLAAALAAGETPSPQMVAAAGETGGLSFRVAVPLVAALIAGVVLVAWPTSLSYTSLVKFPYSPQVLASKAEEMLVRLGYTEPVVGRASGYDFSSSAYSKWLDEHDKSATRWQHVASVRPPLLRFWYRTSPTVMMPTQFFGHKLSGGMAVGSEDPPRTTPGMTYVELDPAGQLVALDAVADLNIDGTAAVSAPDWAALFHEAGLDMAAFKSAAPEWVSRSACDATAAWVGPGADAAGAQLRVEAAAFRGRPVFFRLLGPWNKPAKTTADAVSEESLVNRAANWTFFTSFVAAIAGAVVLSLRNLRVGRTDTRGATRLSIATGAVVLAASALATDYVADIDWMEVLFMLLSWAAFAALVSWVSYAAVEPYVRRRWPQMLISWSRLLDGRWRDPLVGRDLLIGSVLSVAVVGLRIAATAVSRWRGTLPFLEPFDADRWRGLHLVAADTLAQAPAGIWIGLGLVVLLVVFRLALRREWAAAICVVAIFTFLGDARLDGLVRLMLGAFISTVAVIVATRFGLVMYAALLVVGQLALNAGPFSQPGFATGVLVLGLAAAVAPGVFGFFTATRGRKPGTWLDD